MRKSTANIEGRRVTNEGKDKERAASQTEPESEALLIAVMNSMKPLYKTIHLNTRDIET